MAIRVILSSDVRSVLGLNHHVLQRRLHVFIGPGAETVGKDRDLPLTVLSNKPHASTIVCVEEILKDWEFDVVLGQRDSVPHKPDPAGVFEIAEKLQLVPSDFLYLGDSVIDMQTATVAGCVIVGVLWGFREGDELRQHGAQYLIETPLDLLKLLPSVSV